MRIRFVFPILAALLVGAASYENASAQSRFGVRGGAYMDQDDAFVGVHAIGAIARHWMFNPNFEYVLVDRGSLFTINADFHYDLPSRSSTVFWLGGGLGVSHVSFREVSTTDTGLNLLVGASFGRRPAYPFIQAKVTFFDDTALVLGGGITF
jgi:hypothetical protein